MRGETSDVKPGEHILVAVSGGADSVALLHALHGLMKRKRWRLTVAHLDHGIRGECSKADAGFVRTLARTLKLPCIVGQARVGDRARSRGVSLEMAAREARYAFLVRSARKVGADTIATAHTADDQVETLLLKFLRGSGRGGLSGISPASRLGGLHLIRPLLEVTRAEIECWLRAHGREWREDETNADPAFLRNRVRHELLPLLEREYNPGLRQTLRRTRQVLMAEDEWMDDLARAILEECRAADGRTLRSDRLGAHHLAARRRVIRLWLFGQGVPEDLLNFEALSRLDHLMTRMAGSARAELGGGWMVHRHYTSLSLKAPATILRPVRRVKVNVPGKTAIPGLGVILVAKLGPGVIKERGAGPGQWPARASLNASHWAGRDLWVRSWRKGDRMVPFGMKGSRKIQDILVDAKVPRAERSRVPVVECEGEIVWLPGYRIAARWAVSGAAGRNLQLCMGGVAKG